VVLDVSLPDLSGVEVTRRLRTYSDVPVVMLTARREQVDKVVGLDTGADDYITKPFETNEVLARIRVQLRRRTLASAAPPPGDRVLAVGDLQLDTGTRRVELRGNLIALSAREFDILRLLAEAEGRVVERQHLFAAVWGADFFGNDRALDVYVRLLRRKIEPNPTTPRYLHTVRGVGYRLADEPGADGPPRAPSRTDSAAARP
jgi:two-component system response regulator RegX3